MPVPTVATIPAILFESDSRIDWHTTGKDRIFLKTKEKDPSDTLEGSGKCEERVGPVVRENAPAM